MSSSPTRGNEPGDFSVALGPKTSSLMLQGVLFLILFSSFYFQPVNNQHPLFLPSLKFQTKFTIFGLHCKSCVRRKPIPVFNPRPLYCSSLTTAVGFRIQILLILAPLLWHESNGAVAGDGA